MLSVLFRCNFIFAIFILITFILFYEYMNIFFYCCVIYILTDFKNTLYLFGFFVPFPCMHNVHYLKLINNIMFKL